MVLLVPHPVIFRPDQSLVERRLIQTFLPQIICLNNVQTRSHCQKKFIGCFSVEKAKIFDLNGEMLTEQRIQFQNFYDSLPIDLVPCLVNVKNVNYNGVTLNIYCYCKAKNCSRKYIFTSTLSSGTQISFDLSVEGEYCQDLHSDKMRRNVSGIRRDTIANDVVERGAYNAQNKLIMSTDLISASRRNEEAVKTLNALRIMKHEKLAFSDFDSNDIRDILCLKELTDLMPSSEKDQTPQYIKYVRGDQLFVSWYCNSQLDALMQNRTRVLSIDATGNIVKNKNGRVFYYSAVFKSEITGDIIPVLQFLSCKHDVPSLSSPLAMFMRELRLFSGEVNPLSTVVTDFSFALMNAVSLSINNCSLLIYLDLAYRKFVELKEIPVDITPIASCSVHVIKFFSDRLKDFNKRSKTLLLLNFAKKKLQIS